MQAAVMRHLVTQLVTGGKSVSRSLHGAICKAVMTLTSVSLIGLPRSNIVNEVRSLRESGEPRSTRSLAGSGLNLGGCSVVADEAPRLRPAPVLFDDCRVVWSTAEPCEHLFLVHGIVEMP